MSISQYLYNQIMMADDFTCVYCGVRTPDIEVDHFVPRSFGGPDVLHNLFACCPRCNGIKKDRPAHIAGIVPRFGRFLDPALVVMDVEKRVAKPEPRDIRINQIKVLASSRNDDGTYQFSASEIMKMVRYRRSDVFSLVRDVRSEAMVL
jgi:hypothetical protein